MDNDLTERAAAMARWLADSGEILTIFVALLEGEDLAPMFEQNPEILACFEGLRDAYEAASGAA